MRLGGGGVHGNVCVWGGLMRLQVGCLPAGSAWALSELLPAPRCRIASALSASSCYLEFAARAGGGPSGLWPLGVVQLGCRHCARTAAAWGSGPGVVAPASATHTHSTVGCFSFARMFCWCFSHLPPEGTEHCRAGPATDTAC